jgi:hypothetical protein
MRNGEIDLFDYNNARKRSTVEPAWQIIARNVRWAIFL